MLAPNKKFQSPSLGVANVVYLLRNKVDSQIRLDTKARCPIKRGPRLYNLRNLCVGRNNMHHGNLSSSILPGIFPVRSPDTSDAFLPTCKTLPGIFQYLLFHYQPQWMKTSDNVKISASIRKGKNFFPS